MSIDLSPFCDEDGRLRVVLVQKRSRLEIYGQGHQREQVSQLIKKRDSSIEHLLDAHDNHLATVDFVEKKLAEFDIHVRKVYRSELENAKLEDSLVIAVGGDGTVLDAAHAVKDSPILGVNSDPSRSIGALCAASRDNFEVLFKNILDHTLKTKPISRIAASIDDKELPMLALNEVLIAQKNPAATSRYLLKMGETKEEQISSGLWVGTSAGSTGAIVSAGGAVQSLDDKKLQIRVREPYVTQTRVFKLFSGFLGADETLEITSKMPDGQICFDGPYRLVDFPLGHKVKIHGRGRPLNLFVSEEMEKKRIQIGRFRAAYYRRMLLEAERTLKEMG